MSAGTLARALSTPFRAAGRLYRTAVTSGRWLVVSAWIAATVIVSMFLPTTTGGGGVGDLLPPGSEAVETQQRSLELFRVPVLSETAVVVHDPAGLTLLTQADIALWALTFTEAYLDGTAPQGRGNIVAAVPIPTSSRDTSATYLYVTPGTTLRDTAALGRQYAAHFNNQPSVQTYVTGVVPAQAQQGYYLRSRLHVFEVATLVLIAIVVGLAFRSVVAPFVVLFVAGLGYLVAIRFLGLLAASLGFALPDQMQPLIAALVIGVVTDYCVLFFSGMRQQLDRGLSRLDAARAAVAIEAPIVAVAGITVAGGTAALLVADFDLFRAFGPALSLTVVVSVIVSLTLVPALMAILGRTLFLPGRVEPARDRKVRAGRLIRIVVDRKGAAVATILSVVVLAIASIPLTHLRLDLSLVGDLPDDDLVSQGAEVLDDAGIRGVEAPTEVIVEGPDIAERRDQLVTLQRSIAAQPGVAEVLGPAQSPLSDTYGVVFSEDGDAARFVVIFDSDPLAAEAITDLRLLTSRLGTLAAEAGLPDAGLSVTGQTAIAGELALLTRDNLATILWVVLLVELLILVVYLRALLAPLVLLISSTLSVAAALGLTVFLFQDVLGDPGLTFYVPFATAVLLLALGSDYLVFAVGSIWEAAGRMSLSRAIAVAMPSTARAIGAAGVILATTFAMVAIIPLQTFRQVAFTMAVGLLIDTFLIRPVLTPAVLTLMGRAASWPSHRVRTEVVSSEELQATADAAARDPLGSGAREARPPAQAARQ